MESNNENNPLLGPSKDNPPKSTYKFMIFDVSPTDEDLQRLKEKKPEPVYDKQIMSGTSEYQVWSEGYAATGEHGTALQLNLTGDPCTMWKGDTFQAAVYNALKSLEWDMSYYNGSTYWGCRFYDNEVDARKSFG